MVGPPDQIGNRLTKPNCGKISPNARPSPPRQAGSPRPLQRDRIADMSQPPTEPSPADEEGLESSPSAEWCGASLARMRDENPELWDPIDEICRRGVKLEEITATLAFPRGPCGGCGYDLYGNVSGVCPECGRPGDPTPSDRTRRSAQILHHLRSAHLKIWREVHDMLGDREKRRRRHRRDHALQSYLEWVQQREAARSK